MLRPQLNSGKRLGLELVRCRQRSQWLVPKPETTSRVWQRFYVDARKNTGPMKGSIKDSKPVVLPGSASATAPESLPPAPGPITILSPDALSSSSPSTPVNPTSAPAIAPENIPLEPPAPPAQNVNDGPSTGKPDPSTTSTKIYAKPKPPPPPSPPPPSSTGSVSPPNTPSSPRGRKPRRLRRFFLTLFLLTGVGYGLGIYYSLINDTVHGYFTDYVPFAEDAVLYFEELRFRRRFPNAATRTMTTSRQASKTVTIPSGSGISWRVAEEETKRPDDSRKKETRDTTEHDRDKSGADPGEARQHPGEATRADRVAAVKEAKQEPPAPASEPLKAVEEPKADHAPTPASPVQKEEPQIEKSKTAPPIELVAIAATGDPVLQDVVKIFNDIIAMINSDHASAKYSSAVESARSELSQLASRITEARDKLVEEKLRATHKEFDQAAKELVRRLENEMRDQEARWQDEFESERQKIRQSYEENLKTELDRVKEIYEQRLRNEMLEQAVQLKRQFIEEVKQRVEEERNGRLGKLSELSGNVKDLEKLTAGWRDVVDSNLKTQRLHVAVEAVRANLESATQPRPFVRELAALKEIASDDPVVNAAIASINPAGYQRGLPSMAQLIDRFRRVAAEVRKASLVPEHAGAASHAASLLLSKLLFKKQGLALGDDVESVLARAETFLEEGNLDGAAREMNSLTGWAKTLSKDWLAEVRKMLEVHQALDVIATEARLQSLLVEE